MPFAPEIEPPCHCGAVCSACLRTVHSSCHEVPCKNTPTKHRCACQTAACIEKRKEGAL